jgi:phosphoglycerate dehydrogenase-like enzyme
MIERGVLVTNWGSTISYTIAEHAMLLVLAALRKVKAWPDYMRGERVDAKRALNVQSLRNRRVGLHGFGAIARELIPMLKGFRENVQAYSAGVPEDFIREHGVEPLGSLQELFSRSDILIECEALREDTRACVDETLLDCLPEEAVFVNVGRGSVVDEMALARVALHKPLCVGLDVFESEPLPVDSPLRQITGILLSPHIAGPTSDSYVHCVALAFDNLKRFVAGEKLHFVVTPEIYDREHLD